MMTAREAALFALERCRRDEAWSGRVMERMLEDGLVDGRDASLAVNLCLGVLQNDRYLDYCIGLYCSSRKLEPKVRDILRLGAYQILFLSRIPDRAAVSEAVSLCRNTGLDRASGLVNAVLRRISEHKETIPDPPGKGRASYLAVRYSQSDWLTKQLVDERGYEFTEAFLSACNRSAPIDLQINTRKTELSDYFSLLEEKGLNPKIADFPSNCLTIEGGRVDLLPGYDEGLFYVQDRAAAMTVELASPKPGMKVLDACAAPGGKSIAAAIRMQDQGCVVSCDIHEKKISIISRNAERLGLTCIDPQQADARLLNTDWVGQFDLVIADVPCSGFGVMRKKPEIRSKKQADVCRLPELQYEIISNLAQYVALGGTLLYSTCTILKDENERLISRFLSSNGSFSATDFLVGSHSSQNGCYTFWPHIDQTDGFFVAVMKRIHG